MRVLSVQKGADTAGQAIRIKRAFDRYAPDWSFRAMTQPPVSDYISYPFDLRWNNKVVRRMWPDLDVVHAHNNLRSVEWVERNLRASRKPLVLHHHGTQFRQQRDELLRATEARGGVGITSTLDLYLLAPDELEWLPAPYDVDWLASLRDRQDDGVVRVAHAPTNREIKSTKQFLAAMDRLKAEGYPVETVLIERRTWADCLRLKATADIFFDQVLLGFGCNSLEAWGMGIPVISGVDPERAAAIGHAIPDTVADEYARRFAALPYYPASEPTIYEAIRDMVENPGLRDDYALLGQRLVRQFHDEPAVVTQLQRIYRRAVGEEEAVA